jgi:hypothetical protein
MPSSLVNRLVRLIVAHATLIAGVPVLQRVGVLYGGWPDSVILEIVYLFVPLIAAWLVVRQRPRPGAILLLGPMVVGVALNVWLLKGLHIPSIAPPIWKILVPGWIVALTAVQAALSWVTFRVLLESHRPPAPSAPEPDHGPEESKR